MLEHLAAGDLARATVLARQLARRFPRFSLGQLLHAELASLAALDGTLVGSEAPWPPALIELLLEARTRLEGAGGARPAGEPPAPFVQVGHDVDDVVVVDLARSTLALYATGGGLATPVREHYVSSGSAGFDKRREGDRKTPLGLYRVTGFRGDASLPELYGAGALTLDYPNAHDRLLGRTGSGIWLHGVPRARLSRAPHSSEGCVTMSNEHLVALRERTDPDAMLVALVAAPWDGPRRLARLDSARTRYRELFLGYRERRPRGAASDGAVTSGSLRPTEIAALARLSAEAVTIVEGRRDGRAGAPDTAIMSLRLGETRVTLWWSRTPARGWSLAVEDVVRPDV